MGLFSSKKVYVSSAAFNMAGDELERPNFLKSAVIRSVMKGSKDGVGHDIIKSHLKGPGMKFRAFFRWASKPENYGTIGLTTGDLKGTSAVSAEAVKSALQTILGVSGSSSLYVQSAEISYADYTVWAEQWILDNHPDRYETAWTADYNEVLNKISITYADLSTEQFTPTDFNISKDYLYSYYSINTSNIVGPVSMGTPISIGSDEFPPVSSAEGWNLFTHTDDTTTTVSLDTTVSKHIVKSYSDGTPDEVTDEGPTTITSTGTFTDYTEVHKREIYIGRDDATDGQIKYSRETRHMSESFGGTIDVTTVTTVTTTRTILGSEGDPDVIETTTTTTTTVTETMVPDRTYSTDTQEVVSEEFGPTKLHIYKIGSGDVFLDSLSTTLGSYGEFFPFIPVRLNNKFLSDTFQPTAYAQAKKGYKKATNGDLDDLIAEIADNEDVGQMDYVYLNFGVSLNVLENSCKKYLYRFFEKLQLSQLGGPELYNLWKDGRLSAEELALFEQWKDWYDDQLVTGSPFYGTAAPLLPINYDTIPINKLEFKNTGDLITNYLVRLTWIYINDGEGTGLAKPDAKVGELWFEKLGKDEFAQNLLRPRSVTGLIGTLQNVEKIRLYWQRTADSYTYLDIVGMSHTNSIYGGKSVGITATEALDDTDESGFIIPLHYDTIKEMSLVDSTQMSTACMFLVVNTYQVVKKKWWQTGFFKIILYVIAVAVTIFINPGLGIGMALLITAVNFVVFQILLLIIEKIATALFGEDVARIITVIAAIAMILYDPGTASLNFANLANPRVLLAITDVVLGAYAAELNADIMQTYQDMVDYKKEAAEEANKIQQAYFQEFGYGAGQIDPMMFVDSAKILNESSDTFLTRTLLTGSDIAEMATELLSNFAELSTKLPDPYT